MKKRLSIFILSAAMVLTICFTAWIAPKSFLKGISAENIAMISVRDGSTGNSTEIINQEDISFIAGRIQSQSFKKEGVSLFLMGTLYTLRFFDGNDKLLAEFILNSEDTIRKDPFTYKTVRGIIGLTEYIKNITSKDFRN